MIRPRGSAPLAVLGTRVPGGSARLGRDLRRLAAWAAARRGCDTEVSFAVMTDDRIRRLNRAALRHDWETDVLSFPMADPGPDHDPHLGEVAISADTARREAHLRAIDPYHELMLYAVHGVLHLLGHDDRTPSQRRRMRRAEREALAALGLPAVFGGSRRTK